MSLQTGGWTTITTFAGHVLEVLRALTGIATGSDSPGVIQQETTEWVEFTERHLLAEYLTAHHARELLLHDALLDRGLPSTAALPALPGETEADAAQRARYNQVRQPPALLQQWRTLTQPQAPTDPRGHYLSWTGEVVQQVYDYYEAGYHTAAAIPLLTHFVQQRRFAEYTEGATYYIDRTADQLGDYVGSCWTSPEGMAEWARHMEQELWEAFVLHGLDLRYADRQCLLFILGQQHNRRRGYLSSAPSQKPMVAEWRSSRAPQGHAKARCRANRQHYGETLPLPSLHPRDSQLGRDRSGSPCPSTSTHDLPEQPSARAAAERTGTRTTRECNTTTRLSTAPRPSRRSPHSSDDTGHGRGYLAPGTWGSEH